MSQCLKRTLIACIVSAMLLSSLAIIGCSPGNVESGVTEEAVAAETIKVQDSADRYVEVPYPVERIVVLWPNPAEEIKALGAVDRIVGIEDKTKDKVDDGFYPELEDVPVVGTSEEPDYEAIAELDPDVVICLTSYPPLPDEIQEQLEPFGIPVVGLDFYRTDVYYREITTLGAMLGLEEEAADYISFFKETLDMVAERVSEIPDEERKVVYFEGDDDYCSYGGGGYGCGVPRMIIDSGGIDLYPEIIAEWFEADPEDIARRNPDVIVKMVRKGYFLTDDTEFEKVHGDIMARPELIGCTAVQEGEVYVVSSDVTAGARKKFGPMFLAKILYPELFEDLDPEAILKQYYEEYLGLEWQGVYVYPAF